MSTMPPQRDPAARGRATALLFALLLLWPLLHVAEFNPSALFAAQNLRVVGGFLGAFLPPETSHEFLVLLMRATLETLAIASAGIALALLVAVPLALLSTRVLVVAEIGPGPGWRGARLVHYGLRALLALLRGIPELVWALLFVRVFGLGPAAGVLALGLTYGGMLAKVYAEILESGDSRPARAILEAGGSRLAAFLYGLLPGNAQELTSYTVYRWECAVRASVVMGFVGAGGLGQLMDQAMKMLNGGEASTILMAFLLLVLAADALSSLLRRQLAMAGLHRRHAGVGPAGVGLAVLSTAAIVTSFVFLELDLAALLSREAAHSVADFLHGFLSPDLALHWLGKVAYGALETLAISALGTLLALAAALLFAIPAAGRHGRLAAHLSRFTLNTLRSVPELVWATLTALSVGLGPFAGVLALALHTTGVLGRLFAETLENAPPAPHDALQNAGAPPVVAFLYGTLPEIAAQYAAYALYRWEMNIRMAAILGFVGAGGLGQLLYFELSLFHHAQAATVIVAMLLLSVLVDAASARLRKAMAAG